MLDKQNIGLHPFYFNYMNKQLPSRAHVLLLLSLHIYKIFQFFHVTYELVENILINTNISKFKYFVGRRMQLVYFFKAYST